MTTQYADAKLGDTIRILRLANDTTGMPDPHANEYIGKEGVVEYVDDMGVLYGTWGSIGILPRDVYEII